LGKYSSVCKKRCLSKVKEEDGDVNTVDKENSNDSDNDQSKGFID